MGSGNHLWHLPVQSSYHEDKYTLDKISILISTNVLTVMKLRIASKTCHLRSQVYKRSYAFMNQYLHRSHRIWSTSLSFSEQLEITVVEIYRKAYCKWHKMSKASETLAYLIGHNQQIWNAKDEICPSTRH